MPARMPSASAAPARSSRLWLAGVAIVAATFVAFSPALHGEFIWDDDAHVTKPELRTPHGLYRIWFELGATQQYYPLLHSAFWLQHRLWGDRPLGYHLVNAGLHAAAAVLVLCVVRRLLSPGHAWADAAAALTAALFALHPVQVESVAWITEQKNTLSAVFYLAALLGYLRFDATRSRRTYVIAALLFAGGLMTKTVIATLPGAILVIFWWQRGRLSWRRDVAPLLPWFAAGAAAGLLTAWVEHELIGAKGRPFELSGVERGLLAGRVVWFYLSKLAWPARLTFLYPRWTIDAANAAPWMLALGLAALLAGLAALARRTRGPLAAALYFVGSLFPVLGFFNVYPFVYSFVADHFQYLACLGVMALVGGALAAGAARLRSRVLGAALLTVLPAILGVLSFQQARMYSDIDALYAETIRRNPDCWLAYNNLGVRLRQRGRVEEAVAHYRRAIELNPQFAESHNNLGVALGSLGRLDEGIAACRAALSLRRGNPEALGNLGQLLTAAGRTNEAIDALKTALRLEPYSAGLHTNLGLAYRAAGQIEPAVAEFRRSLDLAPDQPGVRSELELAQAEMQSPERAIAAFETALRGQPENASLWFGLAVQLAKAGRLDEAIGAYERVLRAQPNRVDAHTNLAVSLARQGRQAEAIGHFEQAARLAAERFEVHMNLAVAYLSAGRFDEALAAAERARALAQAGNQPGVVAKVDAWISDCRSRRAAAGRSGS